MFQRANGVRYEGGRKITFTTCPHPVQSCHQQLPRFSRGLWQPGRQAEGKVPNLVGCFFLPLEEFEAGIAKGSPMFLPAGFICIPCDDGSIRQVDQHGSIDRVDMPVLHACLMGNQIHGTVRVESTCQCCTCIEPVPLVEECPGTTARIDLGFQDGDLVTCFGKHCCSGQSAHA